MSTRQRHKSWLNYPIFELLSSMRFAVALLTVLSIAAVVGTVIPQNRPQQDYVFTFGTFWSRIFSWLGLYDVYSSAWFVLILVFLVLSTGLCLIRHVPSFIREMKSFRTAVKINNVSHNHIFSGRLSDDVCERFLQARGFRTKRVNREDGVLIAAHRGYLNKLGYVFAHAALIIICLGGLMDSDLSIKLGVLTGRFVPNKNAQYVDEFPPESRRSHNSLSFRGDISLPENQSTDAVFLNIGDKGVLVQELPFTIKLNKFNIDFYENGMPKDFASEVTITNKKTGESQDAVVKVNHPIKVDGVTIYQAGYGDGGSPLEFDIWALPDPSYKPQTLSVRSKTQVPLPLGNEEYRLSFTDFRSYNVMLDEENKNDDKPTYRNMGATITYNISDGAGQTYIFTNYMLPQVRDNRAYYFYGVRKPNDKAFRWLAIPLDRDGSIETFMRLRQAFYDEKTVDKVVDKMANLTTDMDKEKIKKFTQSVLAMFIRGGYTMVDDFIREKVPANEQENMARNFYQTIAFAANQLLDEVILDSKQESWAESAERNVFVLDSLNALTGLHKYPSPLLLQLKSYEEVSATGLQMTRSPGEKWVYLGSFLLTIGCIFMLYLYERRAWILLGENKLTFAMMAGRHKRDLDKEFNQEIEQINQLIRDFKALSSDNKDNQS
ncbi:MAG: cytochrome c biogenesis protein ResB [Neisseriaceae bacterium]|nr:cytochrome c biogenesis protein ResB [Neisseriaceae bacterium]